MTTGVDLVTPTVTEPTGPLSGGRAGLRDAGPLAPGLVPLGVLIGITVRTTGSDPVAGVLGGVSVFAGSAQLTAVTLLDRGLGVLTVVLTAAVVNLRLLLYSAAMGERFRAQPSVFRWLAPQFLVDQTYLMAVERPSLSGAEFRRYWVALCGSLAGLWTTAIVVGVCVAPMMPTLPHLSLAGTALFLGLLVPRVSTRPALAAALVGGAVAAAAGVVAPTLAIVGGAAAGAAAGVAARRRADHHA